MIYKLLETGKGQFLLSNLLTYGLSVFIVWDFAWVVDVPSLDAPDRAGLLILWGACTCIFFLCFRVFMGGQER